MEVWKCKKTPLSTPVRAGTTELFQGVRSGTQTTELVENVGALGIPTIELFQEARIAVNGGLEEEKQTPKHPSALMVVCRRVQRQTRGNSTTTQ